jgi:hypothetical protein
MFQNRQQKQPTTTAVLRQIIAVGEYAFCDKLSGNPVAAVTFQAANRQIRHIQL